MEQTTENPRAIMGANNPPEPIPTVDGVAARIAAELIPVQLAVSELLNTARGDNMKEVNSENTKAAVTDHVRVILNKVAEVEEWRKKSKEPYFRSGQKIDDDAKGIKDRLEKAAEILTKRVGVFNARILAEEQSRRAAEADRLRKIDEENRRQAEETARIARETVEKAQRARKPERVETLLDDAAALAEKAETERVAALLSSDAAREATLAELQNPSNIIAGMKTVPFIEITDITKLDMNILREFLDEDAIFKALKKWAILHKYKRKMDGSIIELRSETKILRR